jgi:hypothetical protein
MINLWFIIQYSISFCQKQDFIKRFGKNTIGGRQLITLVNAFGFKPFA